MHSSFINFPIYKGNVSHFNQAAQLFMHRQPKCCLAMILMDRNKARAIYSFRWLSCHTQSSSFIFLHLLFPISNPLPYFFLFYIPCPFCFLESDLHAVQCGAGAAHTAGPEAALLRQGPVAQGQQLTAQPQVLPAQPRLKATLGVLSEQLAASADVLSSELWEGRRAVSIVPGERTKGRTATYE